jgi:hypothetical protein
MVSLPGRCLWALWTSFALSAWYAPAPWHDETHNFLHFSDPAGTHIRTFPNPAPGLEGRWVSLALTLPVEGERVTVSLTCVRGKSVASDNLPPRKLGEQARNDALHQPGVVSSDHLTLRESGLKGVVVKNQVDSRTVWTVVAWDDESEIFAVWGRPRGKDQYFHEVMRLLNSLRLQRNGP